MQLLDYLLAWVSRDHYQSIFRVQVDLKNNKLYNVEISKVLKVTKELMLQVAHNSYLQNLYKTPLSKKQNF